MKKVPSYLVLTLLFSLLVSGIFSQTSFSCDGRMYFFRSDPNNTNGWLAYFDNYTSIPTVTNLCPLPTNGHNGLAANPLNNLLYYLEGPALRSLDANCNSTIVCPNIGFSSLSGACDNYGRYWTIDQSSSLVAFNINTCTMVLGPFAGFGGALDIAYNLYDCHIYVNSGATLKKVDTNGVIVNTYPLTFTPAGTYGGTAFGSNGLLYGVAGQNAAGNLSVIDVQNLTTGLVFNFTNGPTFARSDMASFACVNVDAYLTATPISGCAPLNVQFTDTSIAYPGPVNYWNWNFGDNTPNSSLQNPTHTYTSPGTYTVTLIVGTTTGCNLNDFDTTTIVITVTNGPNATVTPPLSICPGSSATLAATGGGTYAWSTGATTSSVTVTPTATTTYTVTVSQGLCSGTVTTTVTVDPLPTITTTSSTVCPGDTAVLSASGANMFTWMPMNQTGSTIVVSPTSTTTYTVIGTGANGCTATATATATVANALNATISPTVSICSGTSATLIAGGGTNYLWIPGNMTTVSVTVSPISNTTYTVTVSTGGCSATVVVAVNILALPTVTVSSGQTCEGGSVTLTATGAITYLWTPGNLTGSSASVSPSASQVYTVTATGGNGCSATGQGFVTVNASPLAAFNTDPTDAQPGVNTIYFINTSSGGTSWLWNFGDNSTSSLENPVHTYTDPGTYLVWLIVTNANGCIDSISMSVEIKPDWSIYLPNAFTPDGNGHNELFFAYGTNILEFEMYIFDRWGKLIFQSKDINKGWDGKVQNGNSDALVQEDVYVWKVRVTDIFKKQHQLAGSVTVIR